MTIKDRYSQAVCRIKIRDETRQSGWLFSLDGLIITCGHGFYSNNDKTIVSFPKHKNEVIDLEAEILERKYDRKAGIDFAILKVATAQIKKIIPIRLAEKWSHSKNKRVTIIGYPSFGDGIQFQAQGKLEHKAITTNVKHGDLSMVHISLNKRTKLNGMSGAPVFISDISPLALGIQTNQYTKYKHSTFMIPFSDIKEHSEIIRHNIMSTQLDYPDIFLRNKLRNKDNLVNGNKHIRCITIQSRSGRFANLEEQAAVMWPKLNEELKQKANTLKWTHNRNTLSLNNQNLLIRPEFTDIESIFSKFAYKNRSTELKIIIDFSEKINIEDQQEFIKRITPYLISISPLEINQQRCLDYHQTIVDENIGLITDLINDIYLDNYVFHNSLLHGIYNTISRERSLNNLKKFFLKNFLQTDEDNLGLFSRAARSNNKTIDFDYFKALWQEFFIYININEPDKHSLTQNYIEEVIQLVKKSKVSGRISYNELRRYLAKLKLSDFQLAKFCYIDKKIKAHAHKSLSSIFGNKKDLKGEFKIFEGNELKQLERFANDLFMITLPTRKEG